MRVVSLVLLTSFVVACEPHIQVSPLEDSLPGEAIPYEVAIEPAGNRIVNVEVGYYPKYRHPSAPIPLSATRAQQDTRWLGRFTPEEAGAYRLLVRVTYQSPLGVLSFGRTTINAIADVTVHAPLADSCFKFDGEENDFEGWTASAVFDGESKAQFSKGNCPDLLYLNRSWPHGLDEPSDGGTLFIPVSPSCFPKTSTEVSRHGQWRFDLISPDLGGEAAWQHLRKLEFRFATQTMPVQLTPMVRFQHEGQTITHALRPQGGTDHRAEALPGTWRVISAPVDLPDAAQIKNVIVRVMGTPEQTVTPQVGSLFLDGVCPVSTEGT